MHSAYEEHRTWAEAKYKDVLGLFVKYKNSEEYTKSNPTIKESRVLRSKQKQTQTTV